MLRTSPPVSTYSVLFNLILSPTAFGITHPWFCIFLHISRKQFPIKTRVKSEGLLPLAMYTLKFVWFYKFEWKCIRINLKLYTPLSSILYTRLATYRPICYYFIVLDENLYKWDEWLGTIYFYRVKTWIYMRWIFLNKNLSKNRYNLGANTFGSIYHTVSMILYSLTNIYPNDLSRIRHSNCQFNFEIQKLLIFPLKKAIDRLTVLCFICLQFLCTILLFLLNS